MVRTASAAEDGFPWPADPLPVLRSMYQSPDSEPESKFDSNWENTLLPADTSLVHYCWE